jgi:DNA polymerase (family 10)
MDKKAVSDALARVSTLLELNGENIFRVRAYANASRTIRALPTDLTEAVAEGTIRGVKGIGPHIAEVITDLVENGSSSYLAELEASLPEGVLEVLRIPGLGPKKIKVLMDELDIKSVGELEYACRENRLVELPGFGARSQEKIMEGIATLSAYAGRYLSVNVRRDADELVGTLSQVDGAVRVQVAGSLRRHKEIVKDIDLIASGDAEALMNAVEDHPLVEDVTTRGETKLTARLVTGVNLDLRVVEDRSFPYALQHFTGSKEHNVALRQRASAMGLKSNEYGLYKGKRNVKCLTEEDIYEKLKLEYVTPELREDMGEIEAAEKGKLPALVEPEDIMGTLHAHTVASDGSATLEEMAAACRELGLTYMGITEHSRTASYARGLPEERVKAEWRRIDKLNKSMDGFTIFKGIESDILPDGSLDYPDSVLSEFDFVIGSVHSNFTLPEEEMTTRICRALENPYLDILGHPTGRLLLTREPYAVNMEKVLACAGEHGKAIELNAHPYRLDLDWRLMPMAKKLGIKVAICPDAHSTSDLLYTLTGVHTARKGWLEAGDILNCLTADELKEYLQKKRG